jgi:hypothetical protein
MDSLLQRDKFIVFEDFVFFDLYKSEMTGYKKDSHGGVR